MTSATSSLIAGNLPAKLLAVDTSTATGSLAIAEFLPGQPFKILAEARWNKLAMHSEVATLEVGRALAAAGLVLHDLTHFAVNTGPGSFTGIRVGVNLIRTLAYALEKPVATFSSLEVLAFENTAENQSAMIVMKAIQKFFYAGAYRKVSGAMQTMVQPFSGDMGEVQAAGAFDKTFVVPDVDTRGDSAAKTLVAMSHFAQFSSWKSVKPLYVRGSEAEEKLKKGLLKPLP